MGYNQKEKKRLSFWPIILGIFLVVALIAIILMFQMNNRTTIGYSENSEDTHSLACSSDKVAYPFFTYDESDSKELKINVVFKDNILDSISLVYALTYANNDEAKKSELKNHIDFELGVQDDGLRHEYLHTDHQIMDNVYQLTMYNGGDELNSKIAKYYLLGFSKKDYTQEYVAKAIVKHGLDCINK